MPRKFESQRDRALQKKYGISEKEWDEMFAKQGKVCKICGRPPSGRSLHTEHDHRLVYYKIKTKKLEEGWLAETNDEINPIRLGFNSVRKTKSEAIRAVKRSLLRASIRGICCYGCNSMLRWGHDDPSILRSAAKYLDDYHTKLRGING